MGDQHERHEPVAANGLLHRRMFLAASAAAAAGASAVPSGVPAAPLPVEPWMQVPGAGFNGYGQPSKYEEKVARTWASAPGTTGTGSSRTPHQQLNGMITPAFPTSIPTPTAF
jgi:sulfane dehydrogenase subunit SoxC